MAPALGFARHVELDVDLQRFGGSSLVGDGEIPDSELELRTSNFAASSIPSTYVPARNTVFLSLALAWAEVLGAERIVIGVNALDYSGYPDCRPEFIAAFEYLATLATRAGVEGQRAAHLGAAAASDQGARSSAPGLELGVDYGLTHSCYDPGTGRPAVRRVRQLPTARAAASPRPASPTRCCHRAADRTTIARPPWHVPFANSSRSRRFVLLVPVGAVMTFGASAAYQRADRLSSARKRRTARQRSSPHIDSVGPAGDADARARFSSRCRCRQAAVWSWSTTPAVRSHTVSGSRRRTGHEPTIAPPARARTRPWTVTSAFRPRVAWERAATELPAHDRDLRASPRSCC